MRDIVAERDWILVDAFRAIENGTLLLSLAVIGSTSDPVAEREVGKKLMAILETMQTWPAIQNRGE